MSADNGIYILKTIGPEYRVQHLGAIDNLEYDSVFCKEVMPESYDYDDVRIFNARRMWKNCKVYKDEMSAYSEAQDLAAEVEYTEYGICEIEIPRKF